MKVIVNFIEIGKLHLIKFCLLFLGLQLAMMKELSSKMFKLNYSDAIKDFLPFLITKTIELNLNILAFPWYLTESSSQEEFINQNINSIVLTMVRYQRNMLRDLKVQSIRDLISDVCNSFMFIQ